MRQKPENPGRDRPPDRVNTSDPRYSSHIQSRFVVTAILVICGLIPLAASVILAPSLFGVQTVENPISSFPTSVTASQEMTPEQLGDIEPAAGQ